MMNPESFLANFGHIANAPNGVAVLREAVLTLAMQGKLVKQVAKDVSAIELLQEVEAEKQKLAEELKIKLPKQLFEIGEEEIRYPLPDSWKWVRFGTIALHNSGKTLDKQRNKGLLRDYITTSNLYWGKFDLRNLRQMLIKDEELERCTAKKGDLLICEGGEAGRAAVWTHDYEVSFQNHVHRARFYCDINPYFAYRFFEKLNATGEINQYRKGVGISSMSGKVLASIVFPLPPVAEQKRIVSKVEELMALCDQLEAQQQERERRYPVLSYACHTNFAGAPSSANLNRIFDEIGNVSPDDLRKTILTLAVQGKLVSQDPMDEFACDALARLEKNGGNSNVRRNVPPHVSRSELVDESNLPKSWVIESTARLLHLGAIIDLKDGNHGANHPKVAEFSERGLPFITATQVTDDGRIEYDSAYKVPLEVLKRLQVGFAKPDDVIYTHKGSVGRVAICDRECVLSPQTTYYRLNTDFLHSGFVRIFLLSPQFRCQVDDVKRQTTRDFVSISAQYQFFLRVPPISEQRRIVAKVDALMVLVDRLEAQQQELDKVAAAFAKACVASFTGTNLEKREKMKAHKTELVSILTLGKKTKPNADAPLATLLSKHNGELPAKTLWQQSGLAIDAFYQQLKTEIAQGWIAPPVEAEMKVLEEA